MKPWLRPGLSAVAMLLALWGVVEGNKLIAYADTGDVHTICRGETHGVFPGMTKTQAECDAWDTQEAEAELAIVDRMMRVHQPDARRVALADMIHNEGETAIRRSTAVRLINAGQIRDGCEALAAFDLAHDAHHKPIHPRGLKTRRGYDIELCLMGLP